VEGGKKGMSGDMQNTSGSTSKAPPRWLITSCHWLWRWQILFWSAVGFDIIVNVSSQLFSTQLPLSVSLHNTLLGWMIEHWPIVIISTIILFLLEVFIYYIGHYPSVPRPPVKPDITRARKRFKLLTIVAAFVLLTLPFTVPPIERHFQPSGIGIRSIDNHEAIGICDGSCTFDVNRLDGQMKLEAQEAFNHGQRDQACFYWKWAGSYDTTDAEAKIYDEDQCQMHYTGPYITYIVVVSLPEDTSVLNNGRDLLQGMYAKQKEYNDSHPNGPKIRLLIANIGNPSLPETRPLQGQLANQITQAMAYDSSIVAIVGLPFGLDDLISQVSSTCIPMISIAPAVSTRDIPCFRSVAPSLQDEAGAAVSYIKTTLHTSRISVVIDEGDDYSNALAKAFQAAFGSQFVSVLPYAQGNFYSLSTLAQEIKNDAPDLVYFAGPAEDAGLFLADLQKPSHPIQVMGGDSIYQFVHAPRASKADFNNVYFTSYVYPDEWQLQHIQTTPKFVNNYPQYFDPDQTHAGNPYTYTRANSTTMLAYDAASLLADACNKVSPQTLSPGTLWDALQRYTPGSEFSGLSGQISYQPGSSIPYEKAVLVLQIQSEKTHSIRVQKGYFRQP
jgi:ABC-type branched-subunit amino acid transport system substrate-binding protein